MGSNNKRIKQCKRKGNIHRSQRIYKPKRRMDKLKIFFLLRKPKWYFVNACGNQIYTKIVYVCVCM